MGKSYSKAAAATFGLNKCEPIHRWYSYLEGYSSCLIDDIVMEIGIENIQVIFDPFCGTGTTSLVASSHGIKSYYCETNPFMQQVIEAKINSVKRLRDSGVRSKYLKAFLKEIENYSFQLCFETPTWDGFEKFFDAEVLAQLQDLKQKVDSISDEDTKSIALILLASVTVRASKMIRQGDLQRTGKRQMLQYRYHKHTVLRGGQGIRRQLFHRKCDNHSHESRLVYGRFLNLSEP